MRVLIVGCGYVGLPLGLELIRQGHQVFGLRRSRAAEGTLKSARIQPLTGDITQAAELATLPPAYDWVVDCVAAGSSDVEVYRAVYLEGMRNLIAWLKPSMPSLFVYTSSTSVYGQEDGSIVDEASPTEPDGEQARILVQAERELLLSAQEEGFPGVVLRVAGIYGPDRGYWLKQFVSGAARVEGAGERVLNMVHRDDVVGAILAALKGARPGSIYNVSDDEPVRQRDLLRWFSVSLDRPMPPSVGETDRPPTKRRATNKRVSNRKLKAELEYHFKYPTFREGYASQMASQVLGKH